MVKDTLIYPRSVRCKILFVGANSQQSLFRRPLGFLTRLFSAARSARVRDSVRLCARSAEKGSIKWLTEREKEDFFYASQQGPPRNPGPRTPVPLHLSITHNEKKESQNKKPIKQTCDFISCCKARQRSSELTAHQHISGIILP